MASAAPQGVSLELFLSSRPLLHLPSCTSYPPSPFLLYLPPSSPSLCQLFLFIACSPSLICYFPSSVASISFLNLFYLISLFKIPSFSAFFYPPPLLHPPSTSPPPTPSVHFILYPLLLDLFFVSRSSTYLSSNCLPPFVPFPSGSFPLYTSL